MICLRNDQTLQPSSSSRFLTPSRFWLQHQAVPGHHLPPSRCWSLDSNKRCSSRSPTAMKLLRKTHPTPWRRLWSEGMEKKGAELNDTWVHLKCWNHDKSNLYFVIITVHRPYMILYHMIWYISMGNKLQYRRNTTCWLICVTFHRFTRLKHGNVLLNDRNFQVCMIPSSQVSKFFHLTWRQLIGWDMFTKHGLPVVSGEVGDIHQSPQDHHPVSATFIQM